MFGLVMKDRKTTLYLTVHGLKLSVRQRDLIQDKEND